MVFDDPERPWGTGPAGIAKKSRRRRRQPTSHRDLWHSLVAHQVQLAIDGWSFDVISVAPVTGDKHCYRNSNSRPSDAEERPSHLRLSFSSMRRASSLVRFAATRRPSSSPPSHRAGPAIQKAASGCPVWNSGLAASSDPGLDCASIERPRATAFRFSCSLLHKRCRHSRSAVAKCIKQRHATVTSDRPC